jgi:hypothetical protein
VTATEQEESWAQDAVDAAGGLDLLLTDAAPGRSGGQKKSPGQPGRKGYPVRAAGPGTYVRDH